MASGACAKHAGWTGSALVWYCDRGGMLAVACAWLAACLAIVAYVNSTVPELVMDEAFHVPQARAYCAGHLREWDAKITTLPGTYLAAAAAAKPLSRLLPLVRTLHARRTGDAARSVPLTSASTSQTHLSERTGRAPWADGLQDTCSLQMLRAFSVVCGAAVVALAGRAAAQLHPATATHSPFLVVLLLHAAADECTRLLKCHWHAISHRCRLMPALTSSAAKSIIFSNGHAALAAASKCAPP
jgi:DIE2/ALG10 family